jgi:transposase-like protein
MKCERCVADTHVEKHSVDGYSGYLCAECRETWDALYSERPQSHSSKESV